MQDSRRKDGCAQIREDILLADFAKDDGSGANGFVLSSRALSHSKTCASCRAYLQDMRETARAVKGLHVTAPADFMEGLHEKIASRTKRSFLLFPLWKPATAAAVLLFSFLTVLSMMRNGLKSEDLTMGRIPLRSRPSVTVALPFSSPEPGPAVKDVRDFKPETFKRAHKNGRVNPAAFSLKSGANLHKVKHQISDVFRAGKPDVLHEQMIQIQVKSDRPGNNVSLVLEAEGDAFLEGESEDGKVLTWIGSVSEREPAAILVPVKARGKKTAKIKTTVVTAEGEILHGSVSLTSGKKVPVMNVTENKNNNEKIPGRFLVFIPVSSAQPKNLPSSGISVSVQTGSLALSDANVENVAYVPNPGGSLELVFADSNVVLTGVQVVPED